MYKVNAMRILYVFPHPDDESFGPGPSMSRRRHKYGYSVEEMGDVRHKEMLKVAEVLDLSGMTVLDLPDSGLKELDPRKIEAVVAEEIERLESDVVVTYPTHGVSGFHDHLISHAVVKRVFCALKDRLANLKRCAFFTITTEDAEGGFFRMSGSTAEEIDCVFPVENTDLERGRAALDCYVTFQETIEKTRIKDHLKKQAVFELFQEEFDPPLEDIFQNL